MISEERIKEYVAGGGGYCINPECGSSDIETSLILNLCEGTKCHDKECLDCRTTWVEHHTLTGVTGVEIRNGEEDDAE